MMKNKKYLIFKTFLITILLLISCDNDTGIESYPITNDFRVIQVNYNQRSIGNDVSDFDLEPQLQLVLSHSVNKEVFESSISITPNVDFSFEYDETNSFVNINFNEVLEYETNYVLLIPKGIYGANGESSKEDYNFNFTTKTFLAPTLSIGYETLEVYETENLNLNFSLSEVVYVDVTFDILLEGTATLNDDYAIEKTNLIIPSGESSVNTSITALFDGVVESVETIKLSIVNLVNANDGLSGEPITINVNDDRPVIELKGVMELDNYIDGTLGRVRAIHLNVLENIEDLGIFGVEIATNGANPNPNDIDFQFPSGATATKGEQIFIIRDSDFSNAQDYFQNCFADFTVYQSGRITQNGNDAVVLYKNNISIESFGQPGVDGTGTYWDYTDSWSYKLDGEWIYPGPEAVLVTSGTGTNSSSDARYPYCFPLQIQGVTALLWEGSGTNGGKTIHVMANRDIADMSLYSLNTSNNGGGSDGKEFTFESFSVSEGDHILLAREPSTIASYYGNCYNNFDFVIQSSIVNQNGDDAIELFSGDVVVETYGDVNVDGDDTPWEYRASWGYKLPSGWITGERDCSRTSTNTQTSTCPYPYCN